MENKIFIITEDLIAEKVQRFCNYLIDFVVQIIIWVTITIVIGIGEALIDGGTEFLYWAENMSRIEEYLLGVLLTLFYYNTTEIIFKGRSIAKFITGTVVVMEDGSIPENATIIRRTFCRLIPFDQLSFLGYRGWHDSISETYVVKKKKTQNARELFYSFEELGKVEEL